jgi:hypothetical protein
MASKTLNLLWRFWAEGITFLASAHVKHRWMRICVITLGLLVLSFTFANAITDRVSPIYLD